MATNPEGLHYFDGTNWTLHPIPFYYNENTVFYPTQNNSIIIVNRNRIFNFSLISNQYTIIKIAKETGLKNFWGSTQSPNGEMWVMGDNRIARFDLSDVEDEDITNWIEIPSPYPQFSNFTKPMANSNGRIVFVAQNTTDNSNVILELTDEHWKLKYQTSNYIKSVWPYDDDDILAQIGSKLWQICEHQVYDFEKTGPLSSSIRDICLSKREDFWIATAKGLVKITQSIWARPEYQSSELNKSIDAILECKKGCLYLKCENSLILFNGTQWEKYEYDGADSEDHHSSSLAVIEDKVLAYGVNDKGQMLAFDLVTKEFKTLLHPEGRFIDGIFKQLDDSLIITSTDEDLRYFERFTLNNCEILGSWMNKNPVGMIT
ncbi:hypothetical protein K8I31_13340, partial [bacterium]|nr:hypothetical protein [bacterium]